MTKIGSEAFEGTAWLKAQRKKNPLVVVNHILIDGRTAKGNVTIPGSVTKISEYVFLNCSDKLVIYGKKNSAAERYAKKRLS